MSAPELNLESSAGKRWLVLSSSVGQVNRNIEVRDMREALGFVEYEIGIGATKISIDVQWRKEK